MTELLVTAFVAGLAGSPHCVGMCGSFASVCARSLRGSVAWHAGRITMYATLGALGGFAGSLIGGPAWLPFALSALLLIWFAGVLAGVLPQLRLPGGAVGRAGSALIKRGDVGSRYVFGLVTGLLPCGLLYAALSLAIAAGSPWRGALAMSAFGLATVPALATLSGLLHQFMTRGLWLRRTVALVILVAGLWSLGTRAVRSSAHTTPDHTTHSIAH